MANSANRIDIVAARGLLCCLTPPAGQISWIECGHNWLPWLARRAPGHFHRGLRGKPDCLSVYPCRGILNPLQKTALWYGFPW